jgi:hypothetical protein
LVHKLEAQKPELDQNASNQELALGWFCQEDTMTWVLVSADLTSFSVLIFCFFKNYTCVSPVQVTLETLTEKYEILFGKFTLEC